MDFVFRISYMFWLEFLLFFSEKTLTIITHMELG